MLLKCVNRERKVHKPSKLLRICLYSEFMSDREQRRSRKFPFFLNKNSALFSFFKESKKRKERKKTQ